MNFIDFLCKVSAFDQFNERELELLEKSMVIRDYTDGHVFAKEGSSADAMYLIVEGGVSVSSYLSDTPRFNLIEKLGSGDLFGLVALIDHGPRNATCTAIGPVKAASLPRSAFGLLYQAEAFVGYHFQHLIAKQLVHDLRNYASALQEGIIANSRHKMYEALQKSKAYKGPDRRNNDRRRNQ